MPPDMKFSTLFDGTPRGAAGDVWIRFEEITHVTLGKIVRTKEVWGNVVPCATTGRDTAPEPASGIAVGAARPASAPTLHARNTSIADAQKGHLMALSLGGPDVGVNIVPQWAQWQCSGAWRQMEREIEADARKLPKGRYLFFHNYVSYYDGYAPENLSVKRMLFPRGFIVTTRMVDAAFQPLGQPVIRFDLSQQQDETDDLIALRAGITADQLSDATVTGPALHDDVRSVTRRGKAKLVFDKGGPSAVHRPPPPPALTYAMTPSSSRPLAASSSAHARAAALLPVVNGPGLKRPRPTWSDGESSDASDTTFAPSSPSSGSSSGSSDESDDMSM